MKVAYEHVCDGCDWQPDPGARAGIETQIERHMAQTHHSVTTHGYPEGASMAETRVPGTTRFNRQRLEFSSRGTSLEDCIAKAAPIATTFYGERPYDLHAESAVVETISNAKGEVEHVTYICHMVAAPR